MTFQESFSLFAVIIAILIGICYCYQAFYMLYAVFHKQKKNIPEAAVNHRFAIMIPARNEENVIGELLDSLGKQDYPHDRFDVYVAADNCSDHTAEIAHGKQAIVFEREDAEHQGKGYVLDFLYQKICSIKGIGYYDAFLVFDADNLVDPSFLKEINKAFDTGEYDAITSYRNSKNFSQNWLTAAYSIWFLHEARHLNDVRCSLHSSCMISGTGFLVSDKVMQKNGGWPFTLLTEDIEFSVWAAANDIRIGYCGAAVLYDEQPSSWKAAWNQRLRWTKGFYQVDRKYIAELIKGFFKNKGSKRLACYDVLMTVAPCYFQTALNIMLIGWIVSSLHLAGNNMLGFQMQIGSFFLIFFIGAWIGLMFIALLTVIMEWKRIPADNWSKIKYIPIFPLFILSYIPISIQALFAKVTWKPIHHCSTSEIAHAKES